MREGNDALARDLKRYPDELIGYATVPNPRFGQRAADEVRRCYEQYGMRGIITYSRPEATMSDPSSIPFFETAAELKMPILVHATPAECDDILTRVPDAIINMAHMGGHPWAHGDWHAAVACAMQHDNLYLDTASSQLDNGMLEYAVEHVGPERVLFGTDLPLLDPYTQLAKVTGAELDDDAKQLILGGNMARLLGLETDGHN
jgi:predicted TIM-barrel fold metal-dependent hydrolase